MISLLNVQFRKQELHDGREFIINPSRAQLESSDIDMMIGASADSVMMVEGEMDEIS